MIAQEVATKYASALFAAVKERGLVDETFTQFQDLRKVMKTEKNILKLLSGPMLSQKEKIELVGKLFGEGMNRLNIEFLSVLIRKHRINYLPEVIDELEYLIEMEKGISRATLITATRSNPEDDRALIAKLEAKSGTKVMLEKKVDPSIIGGAIVILRNEIIDGSIRHSLDQLEEKLSRIRVH